MLFFSKLFLGTIVLCVRTIVVINCILTALLPKLIAIDINKLTILKTYCPFKIKINGMKLKLVELTIIKVSAQLNS